MGYLIGAWLLSGAALFCWLAYKFDALDDRRAWPLWAFTFVAMVLCGPWSFSAVRKAPTFERGLFSKLRAKDHQL